MGSASISRSRPGRLGFRDDLAVDAHVLEVALIAKQGPRARRSRRRGRKRTGARKSISMRATMMGHVVDAGGRACRNAQERHAARLNVQVKKHRVHMAERIEVSEADPGSRWMNSGVGIAAMLSARAIPSPDARCSPRGRRRDATGNLRAARVAGLLGADGPAPARGGVLYTGCGTIAARPRRPVAPLSRRWSLLRTRAGGGPAGRGEPRRRHPLTLESGSRVSAAPIGLMMATASPLGEGRRRGPGRDAGGGAQLVLTP